jgi:predicted phosphodiesterase
MLGQASPDADAVRGKVFWDQNGNGARDSGEPGLPGVAVSNGLEVVQTGDDGAYQLPAHQQMSIFVIKPAGFISPLNARNVPQFFYLHQPTGSPEEIQEYPGVEPTGPLPASVDFPLEKSPEPDSFRAVIMGDTQVYNDREIEYLRNSIVREAAMEEAALVITMGDNVGDRLSLYPRYLEVMKGIGKPLYLVPGNHDMNLDAEDPAYAFETFKREYGPPYYAFNYGKVHFVVLNSVVYPSPRYSTRAEKHIHGEISAAQMAWLENDLRHVPPDHLIVLNMHIPLVSYIDRAAASQQVANRQALYDLLEGRKVVALGGHTHTLEHYLPGDEEEGWGHPTPIDQIIVGAVCGSWWAGDLDEAGVPMAYQRLGAPRGYMLFTFEGGSYEALYKAAGKPVEKQMHIAFKTRSFDEWYGRLWDWANQPESARPPQPPVTPKDLPDQGRLSQAELSTTPLVANVWNSTRDSVVMCRYDDGPALAAVQDREIGDPYVLRLQAYSTRYAEGFELFNGATYGPAPPQPLDPWMHVRISTHTWRCAIPSDLSPGPHTVTVLTTDRHGNAFEETNAFEVTE